MDSRERFLSRRQQGERYGKSIRTIGRWGDDPSLNFPDEIDINGHKFLQHLDSATAGMVRIADIKIGHRHRRDLGDIPALARNIFEEVGALLHPIVITPAGDLVSGARRIAAFMHYGRDKIPATVIDIEKLALGEYAENVFHKAFTPSEMADIADTIEPLERAAAKRLSSTSTKSNLRA